MAHWFHRSLLKATTNQNFDLKIDRPSEATRRLCRCFLLYFRVAVSTVVSLLLRDLKLSRHRLLDLIRNPNNTSEAIEPAFAAYLGLLYGLIWEIESSEESSGRVGRPEPSKLRNAFVFKWTHTLLGSTASGRADSVYEAANASIDVALWFMKHAATIAAKDEVAMTEAKAVHGTLRKAAGIFTFVQTEFLPQLENPAPLGSDMDPRVINAYINQCTAEAQEVTVARAVELKHNPSLISALANETSKLFSDAANTLDPLKVEISGQWIKYLELKASFYRAYAYNYRGEDLLAADKCGEAIRALRESESCLNRAKSLCRSYAATKGPAPRVRPDRHNVFKRLEPAVKRTLDKCNRENGLIYHEAVSGELPSLDTKATFGLVSPIDFQMAPANPLWNKDTYGTLISAEPAKPERDDDVPPVKEETTRQTSREPSNESGCNLQ